MTHFLVVSWYVVPAVVIAIASGLLFIVSTGHALAYKNRNAEYAQECARFALWCLVGVLFVAPLWPIAILVGLLAVLFKLAQIDTPKKGN